MKRLIALPAVVGLLAAAAPATQAASPVTQETVPVQSVLGPAVVDPCNGQTITWTGNVHILGAMTTDANGGAVFSAHINFEDVKGTDLTGTDYTITLASNEKVVFAPSSPTLPVPNIETHVIRLNIISHGSTPNFYEDEVGHYTVTPDGQIAVSFDNVDMGCSG
jgi:hypothetical protein